jgi:hypothetical protein
MSARLLLTAAVLLLSSATWAIEPPWGKGQSEEEKALLEKTHVCSDGKGHYVVLAPHERQSVQLHYGDGKKFVQVAPPPWVLSGDHFLEPRFIAPTFNSNFRGLDMRVYSEVELEAEKGTCTLRCGDKSTPLTLLKPEEARPLLTAATFEPNPQKYVPHALLRDLKGRYYLVDRGFAPDRQNNYRVFMGPKGNMKQQQMTDVVTDSEGQIFATKKGELRLVVDRQQPSLWVENEKKQTELRVVPVEANLPLIYNELGVYLGERLGTPCDDQ